MRFLRFFAKQLVVFVPTLLLIITLSFFLMRLAPGGPFDTDRPLSPEAKAALLQKYSLDKPIVVQYGLYLKELLQGDFGPSMTIRDYNVSELIAMNFPRSLLLGAVSLVLATLLGILLGAIAARKQNTWVDYTTMTLSMGGIVIPNFVLAPIATLVMSLWLGLLPAGGLSAGLSSYVLPVFSLGLAYMAYVARMMRGSMIEVLNSNYIRTAYAKGLSNRLVIFRHALRPSILPVVSFLGPAAAGILTGSIVIETIFGLPGIGRYFVQAALARDYPLVMGVTILYAGALILMNILVDIIYGWLDPKISSAS